MSVIITNTCVFVVFKTKCELKCQNELIFLMSSKVFVLITEIFWQTFWRNKWWSVFDVVKGSSYNVVVIFIPAWIRLFNLSQFHGKFNLTPALHQVLVKKWIKDQSQYNCLLSCWIQIFSDNGISFSQWDFLTKLYSVFKSYTESGLN